MSPLRRALVDCEDALCGDIYTFADNYSTTLHMMMFADAAVERIDTLPARVAEELQKAHDTFDLERMRVTAQLTLRKDLNDFESKPERLLMRAAIADFLYGDESAASFARAMSGFAVLRSLCDRDADYWKSLLRRYFIELPAVTVVAKPSSERAKAMVEAESVRRAALCAQLGASRPSALMRVHVRCATCLTRCRATA